MSPRNIPQVLMVLAATATILAAKPEAQTLTLTPSAPNQFADFNPALFPGESVNLTVQIQDGAVKDKHYALDGKPTVRIENEKSLWVQKGDKNSTTQLEFEALNIGHENEKITVAVKAIWKTQPSGGGGGDTAEDKIEGLASGTAYTQRHVFSWQYDQRLQFADGESLIRFTVSASVDGSFVDLAEYDVQGREGWDITQRSDIHIHGMVKTETASKDQLSIHYNNIEQGISPDEIAFANFDLAIAKHGNSENLAEDRMPHDQVAAPPHEMDPGGRVFAPIQNSDNEQLTSGKRAKLTITGNEGTLTEGTYTLSAEHNLAKIKIYTTAEGEEFVTLPKEWDAKELKNPIVLFVGADSAELDDSLIDCTLNLSYKIKLLDDKNTREMIDKLKVKILTYELRDIKDHRSADDDIAIANWNKDQLIANKNIAWIEAHSSNTNFEPRMPQLELIIPGAKESVTAEAKIEVQYNRGNGKRSARNQPEDNVRIPNSGNYQSVSGDSWKIWESYSDKPFFGGDAILTLSLMNTAKKSTTSHIIKFRIGGKNPQPSIAKKYIESLADCGPMQTLWFAYAIAKSESKDYNGSGSRYNQFLGAPRHPRDNGLPLWGNDGGTTPGGYGMFQVTGNIKDSSANIPRDQIWNWQANAAAARIMFIDKRRASVNWMSRQTGAGRANGTTIPSHTVANVTFDGIKYTMTHACTIKAYNGASKPRTDIDGDSISDFVLDPTYPSIGHYCYWHSGQNKWGLCRFNNRGFNYLLRVCEEVEP